MFERFTERARQVIMLAQEEARTLCHGFIGTEHLLLGLLREEHGLAGRVLASLDVTVDRTRESVTAILPAGDEPSPLPQIPFTPRCKKVCELALREALSLGHNYIGTEHILLGLVRESEGVGARVLRDFDVDDEKVRNEVIRLLSGPPKRPVTASPAPAPDRLSVSLSREAMQWLSEVAGQMPHAHDESREVYEASMQVLRLHPVRRVA